jgi:hypothetical protein
MAETTLPARLRRWAGYASGILIVLGFFLGWVLAIGGAHDLTQLHAARSWPARPAEITHSYVRQVRGPLYRRHWHAEIAGKYLDDGSAFNVSRHAYGIQNGTITRWQTEAVTRKYPVGARLDVHSEPGRPRNAILDAAVSATPTWIAIAIGVGLILLPGALYAWGGFRRKR